MDVGSLVGVVIGWFVERVLDWLLDQWKAKDAMGDIGLKRGIRRGIAGMIGSVVLGAYSLLLLVDMAQQPQASGADAVAAALAVGLLIMCAVTFKRRRERWKQCKKLAAGRVVGK